MFLRDKLYKWGRRHVESDNQNIQALIALQNYFIAKYGFKRFCEVKREVDIVVAIALVLTLIARTRLKIGLTTAVANAGVNPAAAIRSYPLATKIKRV